jgi:dethiobiotin synthetase
MAPPMAADSLGLSAITLAELADELSASWTPTPVPALPDELGCPVGCIELAGGLWSPIAHDGDCLDLAKLLSPDLVILVADAGLGTINAIRPAVAALAAVAPVSVFLNRFDSTAELHKRNRMWLEQHCQIAATTSISQLADELLRAVGTPSPST